MEVIKIIGYPRLKKGKQYLKQLRNEGVTPGVLYGKGNPINFYVHTSLLRNIVYTPNVCYISIDIDGEEYKCVLQDIQFHPVSEMILHIDLMELVDSKKIKMNIPVVLSGNSPGAAKGGMLTKKIKKLKVLAYPADMPSNIQIDVSNLDLGKTIKIREVKEENYKILNSKLIPVASVEIPRALRSKANEAADKASKKK